jgi:hypothetical protein
VHTPQQETLVNEVSWSEWELLCMCGHGKWTVTVMLILDKVIENEHDLQSCLALPLHDHYTRMLQYHIQFPGIAYRHGQHTCAAHATA